MRRTRRAIGPLLVLVLGAGVGLGGCGGDDSGGGLADAAPDSPTVTDAPAAADRAAAESAPQDAGAIDVLPADASAADASGPWPPPGPYHNGKVCTLPACDTNGAETTDLSGTWTRALTTVSHNCNALAASLDQRFQTGYVDTMTGIVIYRDGECVYKDAVGGTLVGVIKGNVLVMCEVQPVESGVTPVVEATITLSGGTGTGTGTSYLFDMPLPPANCQVDGTVTVTRE